MRRAWILIVTLAIFLLATVGRARAVELHPLLRSDLHPVECAGLRGTGKLMVAIAFGQSNSANYGDAKASSGPGVYTFYEGICFKASDPLPGATGNGGSVWTRLGDMLVGGRDYDRVIFAPIGVGNTRIADWAPGGQLHERLTRAIDELRAAGLEPTHLLWHQGESDYATPAAIYEAGFRAMLGSIRARGVNAPIFVSVATWYENIINQEIQKAQRSLVNPGAGIFAGPDTDRLGIPYRHDGAHFNSEGMRAYAELWLRAIRNASLQGDARTLEKAPPPRGRSGP